MQIERFGEVLQTPFNWGVEQFKREQEIENLALKALTFVAAVFAVVFGGIFWSAGAVLKYLFGSETEEVIEEEREVSIPYRNENEESVTSAIPNEILLKVFQKVPKEDVLPCQLVCSRWYHVGMEVPTKDYLPATLVHFRECLRVLPKIADCAESRYGAVGGFHFTTEGKLVGLSGHDMYDEVFEEVDADIVRVSFMGYLRNETPEGQDVFRYIMWNENESFDPVVWKNFQKILKILNEKIVPKAIEIGEKRGTEKFWCQAWVSHLEEACDELFFTE